MSCKIIDCKSLFDAIRNKEDDYWKAACVITLNIPVDNRIKVADAVIKSKSGREWFDEKLYEYEDGGDDYA